jgi:hypothetical protein
MTDAAILPNVPLSAQEVVKEFENCGCEILFDSGDSFYVANAEKTAIFRINPSDSKYLTVSWMTDGRQFALTINKTAPGVRWLSQFKPELAQSASDMHATNAELFAKLAQ